MRVKTFQIKFSNHAHKKIILQLVAEAFDAVGTVLPVFVDNNKEF